MDVTATRGIIGESLIPRAAEYIERAKRRTNHAVGRRKATVGIGLNLIVRVTETSCEVRRDGVDVSPSAMFHHNKIS